MDEILTSIRRIISDDPSPAKQTRRQPAEAVSLADLASPTATPAADESPHSVPSPERTPGSLLSAAPGSEAASAFATLNHTVFAKNARTIEDVVQEMLRPMLQTWLDAHLPSLVERLVRQEIERISGRS